MDKLWYRDTTVHIISQLNMVGSRFNGNISFPAEMSSSFAFFSSPTTNTTAWCIQSGKDLVSSSPRMPHVLSIFIAMIYIMLNIVITKPSVNIAISFFRSHHPALLTTTTPKRYLNPCTAAQLSPSPATTTFTFQIYAFIFYFIFYRSF